MTTSAVVMKGSNTFQRMVEALSRHMSPMTATSILGRACAACGVDRERMNPGDVETVIQQVRQGIRLFCPADQVPELMLHLAEEIEAALASSKPDGALPTGR